MINRFTCLNRISRCLIKPASSTGDRSVHHLNQRRNHHHADLEKRTSSSDQHDLNNLDTKPKLILGIETSCDDTCAAVVDTNGRILSNEKYSHIRNVVECGGVMTVTNVRLHSMAIHDVVMNSLRKAGVRSFKELSAIAVTVKPGQIVSLEIGADYAKRLAINHDLPLIPIHHMEAHALTAMNCFKELRFPFLALLISGGHSQIVLFKSLNTIFLIGNSFDCGPGEVIDKFARNMKLKNLGEPFDRQSGGQSVEMLAKLVDDQQRTNTKYKFKDLNHNRITNCDFNFGNIRSHFKLEIRRLREENRRYAANTIKPNGFRSVDIDSPLDETCFMCDSLQTNLVNMFVERLQRAIRFVEMTNILDVDEADAIERKAIDYADEKPICLPLVVSGGVACNDTMMNQLERKLRSVEGFYESTRYELHLPRPFYLCTDNATMIAWNGILKYLESTTGQVHNHLLKDKDDIENLKIESDAKLGINITNLIKKLTIYTIRLPPLLSVRNDL